MTSHDKMTVGLTSLGAHSDVLATPQTDPRSAPALQEPSLQDQRRQAKRSRRELLLGRALEATRVSFRCVCMHACRCLWVAEQPTAHAIQAFSRQSMLMLRNSSLGFQHICQHRARAGGRFRRRWRSGGFVRPAGHYVVCGSQARADGFAIAGSVRALVPASRTAGFTGRAVHVASIGC